MILNVGLEIHMAHNDEWIELYNNLEQGIQPTPDLVELCKSTRTGIGETMLHWYAIEGASNILQQLIDLGFDVNVQNEFGNTPLMEASVIGRWDNVRVLINNGARFDLKNYENHNYFEYMNECQKTIPEWVRKSPTPA